MFIYFYPTISFAGTNLIKVGVLAKRGTDHCLKKWSPTAEYLSNVVQDYTFKIIPIDFNQINQKVKNGDVDFIFANSAIHVGLEVMHGVSRIATLKNKRLSGTYTTFGGVVFSLMGTAVFIFARLNKRNQATFELLRKAKDEAERTHNDTERILNEMPFGVILVGRDKIIRDVNKAALSIMGIDRKEDVIGQICHNNICPTEQNRCPVMDLGRSVDSSERVVLSKDHEQIPVIKSVIQVNWNKEDILLEVFADISERKQNAHWSAVRKN